MLVSILVCGTDVYNRAMRCRWLRGPWAICSPEVKGGREGRAEQINFPSRFLDDKTSWLCSIAREEDFQ